MPNDPAIDAVRAARIKISAELGNDPVRLIAHYVTMQKRFKDRLIFGPEGDSTADRPALAPDESGSSTAGPRR